MDKEINFCSDCFNLTALNINEDKELVHYCKICDKQEKIVDYEGCIYSVDFKNIDKSEIINMNKYITHDRTIPSIKGNLNLICPNKDCSTNTEQKDKSFKYVKHDIENMKYIYICECCGQKWSN